MAKLKNNHGFSLLGVLVAVTLLAGSVIFISRLLVSRSDVVGITRQTFVATNTAREGLELVRAVRDTNWFQKRGWVTGICKDSGTSEQVIDSYNIRYENGMQITEDTKLYTKDGENRHDSTGEATPYKRVITTDCTQKDNNPAFIMVTSTVSWERDGQPRQVTITEKLFNWLPPL